MFLNRLSKWLKALGMPSLEKKDLRICSLHFKSESFRSFAKNQRRLHDYAVPVQDLYNWALHKSPTAGLVDKRQTDFHSPPDFSAHSYLSPASPHVNIHTVKHHYGESISNTNNMVARNVTCLLMFYHLQF